MRSVSASAAALLLSVFTTPVSGGCRRITPSSGLLTTSTGTGSASFSSFSSGSSTFSSNIGTASSQTTATVTGSSSSTSVPSSSSSSGSSSETASGYTTSTQTGSSLSSSSSFSSDSSSLSSYSGTSQSDTTTSSLTLTTSSSVATVTISSSSSLSATSSTQSSISSSLSTTSSSLSTASSTLSSTSTLSTTSSSTSSSSIYTPPGTASTATPLTLAAQPTVTLSPKAAPDVDSYSIDVLTPQDLSQLWYGGSSDAASSSASAPIVRVNVSFEYPSIILDNSAYIIDINCATSDLTAAFNDATAYQAASTSWPEIQGTSSELILMTAASGCSSNGQYTYFQATSCIFVDSSQSVDCTGAVVSVTDVIQEVGIDFGSVTTAPAVTANPALESTYGCFQPTSSKINGLPAIYCGPDFDQRLNDLLGYYSGTDDDFETTLAALTAQTVATVATQRRRRASTLERRCWFLCSVIHAIEHVVEVVVQAIVHVVVAVVQVVETAAEKLAVAAVTVLGDIARDIIAAVGALAETVAAIGVFLATGTFKDSFNFGLTMAPNSAALEDSPWGSGFKFYTWTPDGGDWYNAMDAAIDEITSVIIGEADPEPSIEFWCVNCGIDGELSATGTVHYTLLSGLTEAQISLDGHMYAGLYLGLNAFAEWDPKDEYDFLSMNLAGFEIPDIFSLGPTLSYGVSVDLDIQAVGQYLVGASLNWPSVSATLDLLSSSGSSQSGWTPNIDYTVDADGSLTVASTLGTPLTLGFGVNILNGKWKKEIQLVDTPGIQASLEYDFTNEVTDGEVNTTPADGCYGIAWGIGLVNTLALDLTEIDLGSYTLEQWNGPTFASGCIGEDLSVAAPTTTVTAAPSGQATSAPQQTYPDCSTMTCPLYDQEYCLLDGDTFQLQCKTWYYDTGLPMCWQSVGDCLASCVEYSSPCAVVLFDAEQNIGGDGGVCWSEGEEGMGDISNANCFFNTAIDGKEVGGTTQMSFVNVTAEDLPPAEDFKKRDPLLAARTPTATPTVTSTVTATGSAATASATDAFTAVTITDSTGGLVVNPHVNGSIFISDYSEPVSLTSLTNDITFVVDSTETAIMGDSTGRLLYYFPDTIAAVGASRLRLGEWGSIPETAELIMLLPWAQGDANVLVAVDASLNVYYPFFCGIEGQLNKLFLVSDITTGSDTLLNPDLTYTVIGGVAEQCLSLSMTAVDVSGYSVPTTSGASGS